MSGSTGPIPALVAATAAAMMALAMLAGCAKVDEVAFTMLAGEPPGDRTPYVEIGGANRLGRAPPPVGTAAFRPTRIASEPKPSGKGTVETPAARLRRELNVLKTQLADRDDELQFRRRSLALHLQLYVTSAKALKLVPGDPLPANDKAFAERMAGIRANLALVQGTSRKLSLLLPLIETLDAGMARVHEATKEAISKSAGGADRAALDAIRTDAAANRAVVAKMRAALRKEQPGLIEYVSGQRATLDTFQVQVAKANNKTGPRRTLFQ